MSELFMTSNQTKSVGARALSVTAELTSRSETVAKRIFSVMMEQQETLADRITASQKNQDEMDKLIDDLLNVGEIDFGFLTTTSEAELDKALKSQQSKRSRIKAQAMTSDNYVKMMTAAIAEMHIRAATGKTKGSTRSTSNAGDPRYTEAQLVALKEDQEALTKAIRNVQSKKSIMRKREDFDEQSERWQQLLEAEQQLKSAKGDPVGVDPQVQADLDAKQKAADLLASIETDKLKAADAKKLLAELQETLASKQ